MATRKDKSQKGQVLIFFALMSTALLALTALALDSGNAYYQRRKMQNAADAAARGASYQLATGNYTIATSTAQNLAHYNQVPGTGTDNVTVEYSTDGTTFSTGSPTSSTRYVRVTAQNPNFNTFFLGIVGIYTLSAQARSTASWGYIGGASCLFPVVIYADQDGDGDADANDFTVGACYTIMWDNRSPTFSPGSFGWIDLNGGGGGASELRSWINSLTAGGCSYSGNLTAGQPVDTEPGVMTTLQSDLVGLINSGLEVTVATYLTTNGLPGANLDYNILSFARFQLSQAWIGGSAAQPSPPAVAGCTISSSPGIAAVFRGWAVPNATQSGSATGPGRTYNIIE